MSNPVSPIALAIAEGLKVLRLRMEKKEVWEMARAIEAAEKYIHVNERFGRYKDLNDKKREKYLRKFSKKFFDNNN